ncbi:MAG: hypothetical protein IKF19_06335 [Bacilli bacterium]|nr:hypothetical protein [Bacilli bacterium]
MKNNTEKLKELKKMKQELQEAIEEKESKKDDNDISKEEFFEQLKELFNDCSNSKTEDIEEQIKNKLIQLIIEYNIVTRLCEEKYPNTEEIFRQKNDDNYQEERLLDVRFEEKKFSMFRKKDDKYERIEIKRKMSKKELDIENMLSDIIYARSEEIMPVIVCLSRPTMGGTMPYNGHSYKDILYKLKNSPRSIGECWGGYIKKEYEDFWDKKNVEDFYTNILIPYYIKMGFPTKEDENQKLVPYAPLIGYFDGNRNEVIPTRERFFELKEYYKAKGKHRSIYDSFIEQYYGRDFYWLDEQVFLSPSEMILFDKYDFKDKYYKKPLKDLIWRRESFREEERYDRDQFFEKLEKEEDDEFCKPYDNITIKRK